jgi:hypothetical protein
MRLLEVTPDDLAADAEALARAEGLDLALTDRAPA